MTEGRKDLFGLVNETHVLAGTSNTTGPRDLPSEKRNSYGMVLLQEARAYGEVDEIPQSMAQRLASLVHVAISTLKMAERHGFHQFEEAFRRVLSDFSILDEPHRLVDLVDPDLLQGHEAGPTGPTLLDVSNLEPPSIIGLVGAMGSGKSYLAKYLEGQYNYERRAFAAKLKEVVLSVCAPFGMEERHCFGTQEDKAEEIPALEASARRMLEMVGTEGFRAGSQDVWVNYLMRTIENDTVIEDMRFPNEAAAVQERGGIVIRVIRTDNPNATTGHSSDTLWATMDVDFEIEAASGDVAGLRNQLDDLLRELADYDPPATCRLEK